MLAIDLYCGLGGWAEGLLASGYDVVGFDCERHAYGEAKYPGRLVVQDVRTLVGAQFKDAALIVASPPCTEYSYMAMPWSRGKQIARALRDEDSFPDGYTGSRTVAQLNELFNACFRIQREASEAAGRHIPMIVENVRGAQEWVGRARWRYGSFYLWGDIPALMPIVPRDAVKVGGFSWSDFGKEGYVPQAFNGRVGIKQGGDWFNSSEPSISRATASGSKKRKMAAAVIAKIPFDLARHIGAANITVTTERRGVLP